MRRNKNDEELEFEEEVTKGKNELKFYEKISNFNTAKNNNVVVGGLWKNLSNNELAEKGIELKIDVNCVLNENKTINEVDKEEQKEREQFNISDLKIESRDIEFINPERIKKEEQELIKKEAEHKKDVSAPISVYQNSSKLNRTNFINQLKFSRLKKAKTSQIN